ncbi:S41 family peptidase [Mucilaginibacter koreensis]
MKNVLAGKPLKKFALGAGALILAAGLWSFDDLFDISKNLDVFASVYKEVNLNYVDNINNTQMVKTGVDAMLDGLDPYTEFVPEAELENYKLHYINTQYAGIGVSIFSRDQKIYISDLVEGYPAQKADIRAGDQLVKVNDIDLTGKTTDEVSALLKGGKNATVKLLLKRRDEAPAVKNILRTEIRQPNVSYYTMVRGNMGYIRLDKFLENAADEVTTALVSLQKNKPQGIILDLRSNGGGILQEAVKIVNLFVNKDVTVVSQKGKVQDKNYVYRTMNTPLETNLPLVVLVNGRSASAAEIVAGALQDLDRAVVIGQRSYGKGLVQQTFSLPYNNLVKITIAKYFIPSGRCIQALDYAHRKKDGSVVKLADSSLHPFKTINGRTVYDGSGVYPDLLIKQERFADITQALVSKLLIFDYANLYASTHPKIAQVRNFNLTDEEYNAFVKYLNGKNYTYSRNSDKVLELLKSETTREKQFNEIQAEYEVLKAKLNASKQNDLQQYKPEIKQILENEIADRYYYEKGRYEVNLKYDRDLAEAVRTMQNKSRLDSILHGTGSYSIIGKPQPVLAATKTQQQPAG